MGHPGATPGGPASSHSIAGTPSSSTSGYSGAQLADHYNNCMKLSAENKINVKNAFQLRLIDFMADMIQKKKSELDNFQAASCALDASTKIYSYRVDSVHNETIKLASGVTSRNEDRNKRTGEENEADHEEEGGKKLKKKRRRANTVEKNLNNINCAKFDLEFDIDPLFKKVGSILFPKAGPSTPFILLGVCSV